MKLRPLLMLLCAIAFPAVCLVAFAVAVSLPEKKSKSVAALTEVAAPPSAVPEVEQDGPAAGPPIEAVLTDAPNVPPPTGRHHAAHVVVNLEVKEVTMPIADGVQYTFWTFGGHVPGKFIRVRQGDTVELHLRNDPSSKMPHNIDLHAVSGPGGGAASSFTAPGHESQFTFKAMNAGLFVYHCATAPVGMHIANGMYGMILVEPREGLPKVDREFYVMQGDFYTKGGYHQAGLQPFDMEKAIDERPTYVLFNGAEGALTGDHALQAKVGEKVRIYIGNGGPNLVSSFHMIGAVFEKVYPEGGLHPQENVQTTLIPAGGAAMVEVTNRVPGNYPIVDHSIFRTFNKGALAMMTVTGADDRWVYSGKQADTAVTATVKVEQPSQIVAVAAPTPAPAQEPGKATFGSVCAACHQSDAKGIPSAFPPLAGSDFLMADKRRAVDVVLQGLSGRVTVNGQTFNNMMPSQAQLTDKEIADVLTYVRKNFGNHGDVVSADMVAKERASGRRPSF